MCTRIFKPLVLGAFFICLTINATIQIIPYEDDIVFSSTEYYPPRTFKEWWARDENKKKVVVATAGAALFIGGVYVSYRYGARFISWIQNNTLVHRWWANSTIVFMGNRIAGKEITLEINGRRIIVRQMHVKSQFDQDGGGGASCGYGALFWGDRIREALVKSTPLKQKDFYDGQAIADSHGPEGRRRARVRALREEDNKKRRARNEQLKKEGKPPVQVSKLLSLGGDWLDAQELGELVRLEGKEKAFTVCADFDEMSSEMNDEVVNTCRTAVYKGKAFAHTFILGTMKHSKEKHGLVAAHDMGHYITVVFHTDGKGDNSYTIADTANTLRLQDADLVTPLINLIERPVQENTKGKGEDE